MSQSLDYLLLLRVEKNQVMQLLERLPNSHTACSEMKEEITLIEKVIQFKQEEKGNGKWESLA